MKAVWDGKSSSEVKMKAVWDGATDSDIREDYKGTSNAMERKNPVVDNLDKKVIYLFGRRVDLENMEILLISGGATINTYNRIEKIIEIYKSGIVFETIERVYVWSGDYLLRANKESHKD